MNDNEGEDHGVLHMEAQGQEALDAVQTLAQTGPEGRLAAKMFTGLELLIRSERMKLMVHPVHEQNSVIVASAEEAKKIHIEVCMLLVGMDEDGTKHPLTLSMSMTPGTERFDTCVAAIEALLRRDNGTKHDA